MMGAQAGQAQADQSSHWLSSEAAAIGNSLNDLSDDENQTEALQDYFTTRFNSMAQSYATGFVEDSFERSLPSNAKTEFSISLSDKWRLMNLELNYLQPTMRTDLASTFVQVGTLYTNDRLMVNAGYGHRSIFQTQSMRDVLLGFNAFLDADLTYGHYRASAGAEVAVDYARAFSNVYIPLSSWRKQEVDDDQYKLEARAAKGFDLGVIGYLPYNPTLSGKVKYFSWLDDHVDLNNQFYDNPSSAGWNDMSKGNKGYDVTVAWRPVSLVEGSYTRTFSDNKNSEFKLSFVYQMDQPLEQQLQTLGEESNLGSLDWMLDDFVERENEVVLAYRGDKSVPFDVKLLPAKLELEEGKTSQLNPTVSSPLPVAYRWKLTDSNNKDVNGVFDNPALKNPKFKHPAFTPSALTTTASNEYKLRLDITDIEGRKAHSDIQTVAICQKGCKNPPALTFYADAELSTQQTKYTVNTTDDQQPFYWSLTSERPDRDPKVNLCADLSFCHVTWVDEFGILDVKNPLNPIIKTKEGPGAGDYDVILNVTHAEGAPSEKSRHVKIKVLGGAAGYKPKWDMDLKDNTLKKKYGDAPFENKVTLWKDEEAVPPSEYNLTFSVDDETVAQVAGNKIEIVSAGDTSVIATFKSKDNSKPLSYGYILHVAKAVGQTIQWKVTELKDTVIKARVGMTEAVIDYQAEGTGDAYAASDFVYTATSNDKPTSIASVDNSGRVTLNSQGEVTITASAVNNNYDKSTPIEYKIKVVKGNTHMSKWRWGSDQSDLKESLNTWGQNTLGCGADFDNGKNVLLYGRVTSNYFVKHDKGITWGSPSKVGGDKVKILPSINEKKYDNEMKTDFKANYTDKDTDTLTDITITMKYKLPGNKGDVTLGSVNRKVTMKNNTEKEHLFCI